MAYKITFSASNWTQTTPALWWDAATSSFYDTQTLEHAVTSIVVPVLETWRFDGFRQSSTATSSTFVNPDGTFTDAFYAYAGGRTGAFTVYVAQTHISWKVTLSPGAGTGGDAALYKSIDDGLFYLDDLCRNDDVDSVLFPSREGYSPKGYYSSTSGGTQYIGQEAVILPALRSLSITSNRTIYAQWTATEYVLSFDYSPGSGGTQYKVVTFGTAIGTLPSGSWARGEFSGWSIGDRAITSATVWDIPDDAVAAAVYDRLFGRVTDWFGLGSDALIPESARCDDVPAYVAVAHRGRFENGVTASGGIWRAPSVTYRVVKDVNLSVVLGAAFAGVRSQSSYYQMAVSGYMIVLVAVHTALGEFPTVTVSAAANEGYVTQSNGTKLARATPSINTANVSVVIRARARAQALGVFVDSEDLSVASNDVVFSADAVVLDEDMMPCASDVVNMRAYATVVTNALTGSVDAARPTAAAGWTRRDDETSNGGTSHTSISTNFERGL